MDSNKTNKVYFLLIKNFNKKYKVDKFNFFEIYGNCKIHYLSKKNYLYLQYDKIEPINHILQYKEEILYKNFGKKITFYKIHQTPLDLNGPSNIILIIFYNKYNIEIDKDFIINLLINIGTPEKLIFFKKNNSDQALIKFEDINLSIKAKDTLPTRIHDNKIFLKVYYTEKKDIIVNENKENEFDFSVQSSLFNSRNNLDSVTSLNNIKDSNNSLFKVNSIETNKEKFHSYKDFNQEKDINCINIESINFKKLKISHIFNLFSLYGYIKDIKLLNDNKAVLHYKNNIHHNKAFNILKQIPIDVIKYEISLPAKQNKDSDNSILANSVNDLNYHRKLKKNKTIKISKFQKLNNQQKNISIDNNQQNEDNFKIHNFTKENQRKFILRLNSSYKIYPSNFLIIGNLSKNIKLITLKEIFKTKIKLEGNFIKFFQKIKNNKYILICSNFIISYQILINFHNYELDNKKLNILFAEKKTLDYFKKTYQIKLSIKHIEINDNSNDLIKNYGNSFTSIKNKNKINDINDLNSSSSNSISLDKKQIKNNKRMKKVNSDYKLIKNKFHII